MRYCVSSDDFQGIANHRIANRKLDTIFHGFQFRAMAKARAYSPEAAEQVKYIYLHQTAFWPANKTPI